MTCWESIAPFMVVLIETVASPVSMARAAARRVFSSSAVRSAGGVVSASVSGVVSGASVGASVGGSVGVSAVVSAAVVSFPAGFLSQEVRRVTDSIRTAAIRASKRMCFI